MYGFTVQHLVTLLSMAGDLTSDGAWSMTPRNSDRPSGGKRKGGVPRIGMRHWLFAAQGGICAACGRDMVHPDAPGLDMSHVVGSGPMRRGYVAGNIYLACHGCNAGQSVRADEGDRAADLDKVARYLDADSLHVFANVTGYSVVLTPADFIRPDVIPMEWPTDTVGGFIRFDPAYEGKH